MSQVSVVIPVFNRRHHLLRALQSVLLNDSMILEILVVDDASTDGLEEDYNKLYELSSKICILRNETNRGVSYSRNRAILEAKAPWVALLDSDDEWLEAKLEKQLKIAELENTKIVHTEEIWIRNGRRVNQMKKHKKFGGEIFSECFEMCKMSPSSIMIHKDVFERSGVFNEGYPVCEDFELWLRICLHHKVSFIEEPLILKYGGHEDQLSRKFHSMDYWRIKALDSIYEEAKVHRSNELARIREVILNKSQILLAGYKKHDNWKDYDEVLALNKKYMESL